MGKLKKYDLSYITLEDFEDCLVDVELAKKHYVGADKKELALRTQQVVVYANQGLEALTKACLKLSGELFIWISTKRLAEYYLKDNHELKIMLSQFSPIVRKGTTVYNIHYKNKSTGCSSLPAHMQEFTFQSVKSLLKIYTNA